MAQEQRLCRGGRMMYGDLGRRIENGSLGAVYAPAAVLKLHL